MAETVFDNAPLVEVIAELRWQTVPISTVPGGSVDPFFDSTLNALRAELSALGLQFEELVVPAEIPKELLTGKATNRFRSGPNQWPLFQIGPGIFTANITPPYDGWTTFVPFLRNGLDKLFASYPASSQTMKLEAITLKYVDAFTAAHGRQDAWDFLSEGLGFSIVPPAELIDDELVNGGPRDGILAMSFNAAKPLGSTLNINISNGTKDNAPATIFQIGMTSNLGKSAPNLDNVVSWFNDAHEVLSKSFRKILRADVIEAMGPEREVQTS